MPYVNIPKDLSAIKTKVAFGLTKRQLVCFSIAAVTGIPFYFLARSFLGNDIALVGMILLMLPMFFIALFEKDGQPLEKVLKHYIQLKRSPTYRVYQTKNIYNYRNKNQTKTRQAVVYIGEKRKRTANKKTSDK